MRTFPTLQRLALTALISALSHPARAGEGAILVTRVQGDIEIIGSDSARRTLRQAGATPPSSKPNANQKPIPAEIDGDPRLKVGDTLVLDAGERCEFYVEGAGPTGGGHLKGPAEFLISTDRHPTTGNWAFKMRRGEVFFHLNRDGGKKLEQIHLETNRATLANNGTMFQVIARDDRDLIMVDQGSVRVALNQADRNARPVIVQPKLIQEINHDGFAPKRPLNRAIPKIYAEMSRTFAFPLKKEDCEAFKTVLPREWNPPGPEFRPGGTRDYRIWSAGRENRNGNSVQDPQAPGGAGGLHFEFKPYRPLDAVGPVIAKIKIPLPKLKDESGQVEIPYALDLFVRPAGISKLLVSCQQTNEAIGAYELGKSEVEKLPQKTWTRISIPLAPAKARTQGYGAPVITVAFDMRYNGNVTSPELKLYTLDLGKLALRYPAPYQPLPAGSFDPGGLQEIVALNGDSRTARITGFRNNEVKLQQKNGRTTKVKLNLLSIETREIVQQWLDSQVRDPETKRTLTLTVEAKLEKTTKHQSFNLKEHLDHRMTLSKQAVAFRITNRSGVDLQDVELDYAIPVRYNHVNKFTKQLTPPEPKAEDGKEDSEAELDRRKKDRDGKDNIEQQFMLTGSLLLGRLPITESTVVQSAQIVTAEMQYTKKQIDPVIDPSTGKKIDEDLSYDKHTKELEVEGILFRLRRGDLILFQDATGKKAENILAELRKGTWPESDPYDFETLEFPDPDDPDGTRSRSEVPK